MADADPNPGLYYTVEQAADLLYVSKRTLRRYIRSGALPARRWGRRWLVPREAVDGADLGDGNSAAGGS